MNFVDVIARKRDGHTLSREDLDLFVAGFTANRIPDYQASALLMAIVLRGMTDEETSWLTDAMLRSGDRVDLSAVRGPKVGKHSTGGVGDKVSIALAPIVAACGVVLPKMSGRGLGHTGGTLDKLESIPGFRVNLSIDEFVRMLSEVGTSIIGQTARLVPADKRLYALRDVTATVPSASLIAASVMSKKLAEGTDALVLDVKVGDGAFMRSEEQARELARLLVVLGTRGGLRTEAFLTRMDEPLGRAVGNAIEMIECFEVLKGRGPDDLVELVVTMATRIVALAGADDARAEAAVRDAIRSNAALDKLRCMVEWQGGDPAVIDDYKRLPGAAQRDAFKADRTGYVSRIRADLIGRASMALGAGRQQVGDSIDHGAGVVILRKLGEAVAANDTILELLHNDSPGLEDALALTREAIEISDSIPPVTPRVIGTVR